MSDRPPDSDTDWSEEELLLLRSADDDRPSSRALAATLAAVGLGAASGAATTAAAATTGGVGAGASASAAKWGSAIAITKWVSIVALGGAVAVTGIVVERHASQETHAPAVSERPRARAVVSRAATPASEQNVAASSAPTPAAENSPIAPAALRPPRLAPPKRKETSAPSQPDLSREIAVIDDARTALRSGRARDALTVLDRYDAELAKSGSLQLEAAALRIEALFALGDRGRAQSLASAFLAKHSTSPYAARIRVLIKSDSAAP